ncbi:MAG: hypothetical protein J5508_07155, partial [Bacteroidales bacterium]|nr:hypothetical protein [Bacteroidales bacterium]
MEEEKTVQENTPEMEVAVETPEVKAESPKHKSNASVSNDSFNWDEFENETPSGVDRKATEDAYNQTLSRISENDVVEGVVTAI